MKIIKTIQKRAKDKKGTIILPEANLDKRVYDACKIILKKKLSNIIVFGKMSDFDKDFLCPECTIIDIENYKNIDEFANMLFEIRKSKGLTLEQAKEMIIKPEYFSMILLKKGMADGMVAGAKWTTANTLRPALQIIKTKPNKSIVVGVMLLIRKDYRPLVYGDISLCENPSVDQLAEIAISSAEFMDKTLGIEPKVAMLSYSTKGSAKSEMVTKVTQALEIAKKNSDYLIDGEMQGDSALNPVVAKQKGITSKVGGNANVLIFPDLNAGNIAYKITSTLGGFLAVGPIMLNFAKPVIDLSRGSTTDEIVNTVCITKLLID